MIGLLSFGWIFYHTSDSTGNRHAFREDGYRKMRAMKIGSPSAILNVPSVTFSVP